MIRFLESKLRTPDYSIEPSKGSIILYHNTTGDNVNSILEKGLIASKGKELGRGFDGDYVWAETRPDLKGYGGYTIAFEVPADKLEDWMKVNDTQYTLPFDIPAEDIVFVDRPIMDNYRESDIKDLVQKYGKDKVKQVFSKREYKIDKNFTLEQVLEMIDKVEEPLDESKISIPKGYEHMVDCFYKTATGEWCIDLKPGYSTSYGTSYIICKTKSECIYELKNFVSEDVITEKKEKKSGLEKFKEKHGIETVGEGSIGFSEKEQKWYGWSHRAIYGFEIGHTVKEGDIVVDEGIKPGFKCKTLEDCKKLAKAFSNAVS